VGGRRQEAGARIASERRLSPLASGASEAKRW
jgi:hypothetical protein